MMKTTLCYIINPVNNKWLMLFRNRKKNDVNQGKWIGVGGKVEQNETVREGMKREILEETGFIANSLDYRGIIYFTYDHKDAEKIYVYTCNDYSGSLKECSEGTLAWIDPDDILDLPLWEGDSFFLKKLLNSDNQIFCYDLHYDQNGNLIQVKELEAEKNE